MRARVEPGQGKAATLDLDSAALVVLIGSLAGFTLREGGGKQAIRIDTTESIPE